MPWPRSPAHLLAALLCTSCTTILGVDEGVLDEAGTATSTGAGTSAGTTTSGATSSTGGGGGSSSSTGSGDGGGSTGVTTTSTGTGGTGGGGDGGGAGGGVSVGSAGGGGDGGAATSGSTGAGGGGGGGGGTSTATTTVGSGGGGGGTGGGGGCPLAEVAACPGVQPTSFTVAADLVDHWDVLSPQAEVNAANQLALRISNGSTEARIQARMPLDRPTSCGVWVDLRLPSSGAGVASGLALVGAGGTHAIYRLEGELRVRDAAGGIEAIPYDAVDTAMVRARFDAAGDLWLDTSADGACWTAVDGPFVVGDAPLDVQLFVERPGTAGSTSSTFDDYTL